MARARLTPSLLLVAAAVLPVIRHASSFQSNLAILNIRKNDKRQLTLNGADVDADGDASVVNTWKPSVASLSERKRAHFLTRQEKNDSETLASKGFHHIEFYCGDAKNTAMRFQLALGMPITCWSSQATGNDACVSYGLESGDVRFVLTAPLSRAARTANAAASAGAGTSNVKFDAPDPFPGFDVEGAHDFIARHGMAVRAVGVEVEDAGDAFEAAIANGAVAVLAPTEVPSHNSEGLGVGCKIAEVQLYGDVVLRLLSFDAASTQVDSAPQEENDATAKSVPFLPNLAPMQGKRFGETYGLQRIDHTVGNVPDLRMTQNYIQKFTGFHPFAEFTSEDVGTVDSGLNSIVLASDSESVLLPLNEPTEGRRKSQIQTFLEQNEGPGMQHIAIKSNDIFETIEKMRHAEEMLGGFELMVRPSDAYYRELPTRLGDKLDETQYDRLEELGILADADEEGVLLQIFTKPLGDRPTVFLEIIQRIGCVIEDASDDNVDENFNVRPGCGGFGQGNFKELFKAIEDHEKTLKV